MEKEALGDCDGKVSARVEQMEKELLVRQFDVGDLSKTATWPEVLAAVQIGGVPAGQVSSDDAWKV